ncbi:MAG: membrane protein insertase YidC [Bacteroidia bacterium]
MNDRNSTIGLVLMMVLLGVYFFVLMPQAKKEVDQITQKQQEQVDQTPAENGDQPSVSNPEETQVPDSVKQQQLTSSFGPFAQVMDGEAKTISIKTDVLDLKLNTKGGMINSALLARYKTYGGEPLPLLVEGDNKLVYDFAALVNSRSIGIKSSELIFESSQSEVVVTGNESQELKLVADLGENRRIEHIYTFKGNTYDVGFKVHFAGMDQLMKNNYLSLDWNLKVPQTEKDIKPQRTKTNISYRQDGVENMGGRMGGETSEETVRNGIDWVSLRSQFFSTILIPDHPFSDAKLLATTPSHDEYVKKLSAEMAIDLGDSENGKGIAMTWYMGPNEYKTLKSYGQELEKQINLGPFFLITWINKGTIWLFKVLENLVGNYGLIILIFAILVKMIVFPMTYKSYVSMAKLRVINQTPEMKELDEKYKGDPQKLNLEKMAVYRKMKVSPLGGCLPMILQYPILIAMFYFFPESVELRQKSFLWAEDLSTYDSIYNFPAGFSIPGYGDHVSLFCLLMVASIYVYTYYQQKSQGTNTAAMPMLKYIPYIFPIMFLIFLNNYSSGLSWYYFAANIISILQTTGIRATLDDEKLLNQMRAVAHAKKGKSGKGKAGKSRIERWAEKQQERQRDALENRRSNQQGGNRTTRRKNKK